MTQKWMSLILTLIFSWVFVGALVNFHQVHVLSKDLPQIQWSFVKPKSAEKQLQADPGKSCCQIGADDLIAAHPDSGDSLFSCNPGRILRLLEHDLNLPVDQVSVPGLRAPPMA